MGEGLQALSAHNAILLLFSSATPLPYQNFPNLSYDATMIYSAPL